MEHDCQFKGGIGKHIPNDNCVKIQVHNIKSQLNTQGSNKSFESARQICMTTQVVGAIKENLIARQISETIVHIVVQAPTLTWRLLREYLFGKFH